MRNKDFDKLLKDAIIQEAEEQGRTLTPDAEPIPAEAQARFDTALNGKRKEPKKTNDNAFWEQPQPVKRAHRWLAYGLTAVSAAAVVLVVVLILGAGGIRGAKAPAEPPDVQSLAEATAAPEQPGEQPYEPTEPEPQEPTEPEPEDVSWGPSLILNGKTLNVYTEHYFIKGTDIYIPINAFLESIGSYYVDSPYNKYQVQCSEIQGIRYIYDWELQVFALAEQYDSVVQTVKAQGKTPTHADFQTINLMPEGVEMQAEARLDHITLENVLRKMGLDITIELDRENNAIRVTMSEPEAIAVPDDPERPDLHLFAKEWQGYTCLFPETFEIWKVGDSKLSATENALLQYDTEKLQSAGLLDMDYYLVAESMLNGQDLLTWYLAADGWDDKPEDFDAAESVEIAPGIVSVHYYNRNYASYICIAKLNTIGTNTLFLAASSMTKEGTADFDNIVKRFLAINGDFAPSDTGILNGKYGKSKVFAGDGYQITLTEQFSEQKSEMGFDGYYTSYFSAVMIKIEPFTLKKGLADETVMEYIEGVINNNKTDAKPEEKDGLVFYRYQREGMCGWNFAFKGEKAFCLVQFLCREADASELEELFFSIAGTVKLETTVEPDDSIEIKTLVGTWTMVDPPSSMKGYTFELVFESEEKVTLKVSLSGQFSDVAFSYIFENYTVHLYMEDYDVHPDGSIVKGKKEYYLFVSDGVITYDLETDSLLVPNDEGGQTRFIRKAG